MKPIVLIQKGHIYGEAEVCSALQAEGYLVIVTARENAVQMLDPNKYEGETEEVERTITIKGGQVS